MIQAVVFDVGETLVDETREYGTWADWLGIPRHTFSAMFGAVIALGMDYREVFQFFSPGFNLEAERSRRADSGKPETFGEADIYPDVPSSRHCVIWVFGLVWPVIRHPELAKYCDNSTCLLT